MIALSHQASRRPSLFRNDAALRSNHAPHAPLCSAERATSRRISSSLCTCISKGFLLLRTTCRIAWRYQPTTNIIQIIITKE